MERAVLRDLFFFRDAEDALDAALGDPLCTRARFSAGQIICDPTHFTRGLGVLLTGRVRVSKPDLVVSILSPGECFGASSLYFHAPEFATTLTALTDSDVIFFAEGLVRRMLWENPAMAAAYMEYLSGRIHFLSARLDTLTAGNAEGRLAQYLLSQAGEDLTLSCPATELAQRLSMGRASVYRAFAALEAVGAIRREGKRIRILDTQKLASDWRH